MRLLEVKTSLVTALGHQPRTLQTTRKMLKKQRNIPHVSRTRILSDAIMSHPNSEVKKTSPFNVNASTCNVSDTEADVAYSLTFPKLF